MDLNVLLFFLSSVAGLILTVGSLFLLLKGRITLDSSGNVTEMDLPLAGKIKTQTPVLIMFLLGAFLLFLPQYYKAKECIDLNAHQDKPLVKLTGEVESDEDLEVYAVIDYQRVSSEQPLVELTVPHIAHRHYSVLYLRRDGTMEKLQTFTLANNITERPLDKVRAATVLAANNEIVPARTVSTNVESNYK